MERKEIIENLEDYIKLPNTDYAIMIDGEWGIGKSFFITKDLHEKINEINSNNASNETEYKKIYISLFGISSIQEIQNEIFFELNNKINNNTKSLAKKGRSILGKRFNIEQALVSVQELAINKVIND